VSRFFNAVVLILALAMPGVVQAQSCTPPVIIQVGGANPACAGQPVMLDAGSGWSTYQWSPGGATTRMISDTPSATMSYTVTTTDANGCSVSSQPLTVVVNSAAYPPPAILGAPSDICPSGSGSASIDTPSPDYTTISWTVQNGTIAGGGTSHYVSFQADGSGLPLVATVAVADANGCPAQSSVTIPIRTISAPAVHTFEANVCPTGNGDVYVDAPASGNWQTIYWTIEHGSLPYGNTSPSAFFTADGSGLPVVLHVTVTDFGACQAQNSITIPIRTISAPAIHTFEANVCPTGNGDVYVDAPASGNWQTIYWTIEHGSLPYGNTSPSAFFTADGSGLPVVLHVTVTDFGACQAQNGITIPIRTISAPAVHTFEANVCPTGNGDVYVDAPASGNWQTIYWTIEHGSLVYGNTSPSAMFTADGSGLPVVLHVTVTDFGACQAQSSITIPVQANTTATIHTDQSTVCINGYGAATLDDAPPENPWTSIYWVIENGTVVWGQGTARVNFQADGSGNPVVVHVSAQGSSSSSCLAQSSVTLPTRVPTAPVLALGTGSCPANASVTNASDYTQFLWSADNAEMTSSLYDAAVTFHAARNGHVTLTVVARDASGCESTASIGYDASGLPDITMSLPGVPYCYGVPATASVPDGGPGVTYQWSMSSGRFLGSSTTPSVTFIPQADTLALSVIATNAQGCTSGGTTYILVNRPPVGDFNSVPASVCANGMATISTYSNGVSYAWQVIDGDIVSGAGTSSITFRAHTASTVTVRLTKNGPNSCGATYERIIPVTAVDAMVTASGPTTFCTGGNVTLTAASGVSYLWSTGATTQSIAVNSSGSYSVTIANANGCSAQSAPVTVTVTDPPLQETITPTATMTCGGTVALIAPNGYGYLWTTGETTRIINVGTTGSYGVTITNAGGCSTTLAPVSITVSHPTATITPSGPTAICAGGSVTLTANSGRSYYWSTGAETRSITVSAAGTYTVSVDDTNNCAATSSPVTVTVDTPVATITAGGPPTFCPGGSVTLTANVGSAYAWSTGATTQAITVAASGSYSVSVMDAGGCSATSAPVSVTVNANSAVPVITADGPTTFCDTTSVGLTSTAASSYLWSNGATTRTIFVNTSGSFSVTITDANGCRATSAPITITALPRPVPTVTIPAQICAGTTGHASVAETFVSYQWSATSNGTIVGPANGQSVDFTSSASGTCSLFLLVTNANGCQWGYNYYVNVQPEVAPSINAGTQICTTDTGNANVSATAGSTWDWSATNATITGTFNAQGQPDPHGSQIFYVPAGPGTVTLTVVEHASSGCNGTASQNVTVQAPAPTEFTVSATCPGGVGTASASLVNTFYSWSITNGSFIGNTTNVRNVSFHMSSDPANPSVITLTASNGPGSCVTPATHTVPVATMATPTITPFGSTTFCAGGSVTLTASSASSYHWSTGATTQSITATTGGSYTVTVTNASGCSATSSPTVVTVNPSPTANITADGPMTFCAGGSVTLTASSGASYLWSTGATTPSIVASTTSNYSVTVTNANGCTATSSATAVTVNPNPTATITAGGPTTFCAGGSVTLTASSGSSYLWSTGATTQAITASTSGNYSVTVTNANGCSATSSATTVTVNANPTASITAGGPTTFCAGGSVTLTASSGSSYLWSTGATTQSIVASTSGNYSVTVTNANGCSAVSSPTAVTVNANPTATITAGGPTTFCAGGSVTLTASNGASYLWSTGATTQSIVASTGGNYSVTVTNANGCSATSSPTAVTVNANPTATITAGGPTTFCAGGSVTLTASSGSSYLWSTGATTASISATASGNYSVTVTNANGCSAVSSPTAVTVNANPTASITAGGPTTFCAGGSVTLTASSGTSYLWSTGATTQSIVASASGNYSVTVTNANGCSAVSSPTAVTVNANPTASITAGGPTTFCAGGSVTLTASSGASYLWSTGATTQAITASTSGNYSVTVTNANGCSTTSSATPVTINANPTATITAGGPTTFCAGGSVTLTASSGSSYLWSTGATTQAITASTSGNYTVTVTNANGCSATSSATTVTVNANPTATITAGGPTTFCAGGTVTLTASSGTSYLWSTGATTQAITVNATGNYNVTVTNASGCNTTSSATAVTTNANPTATITAGGPTTFCAGGSVTLTASSGSSYLWSTGATTQAIVASSTGNYSVTVTNANGCSATSSPTAVNVRPLPTASVSGGGTICPGGSTTITASLTGTAPWSVTWSDGNLQTINGGSTATRNVSPSATTTYTVTTVSDAASCPRAGTGSAAVTVNVPASITTQPVNKTTTRNTNVTLTVVAAGTSPISYQWFNGNGTVVTGATAASYTTSFTKKGTNTFYVEVWNACNATHARSNTITVTVN
jgi:hypothetical protein